MTCIFISHLDIVCLFTSYLLTLAYIGAVLTTVEGSVCTAFLIPGVGESCCVACPPSVRCFFCTAAETAELLLVENLVGRVARLESIAPLLISEALRAWCGTTVNQSVAGRLSVLRRLRYRTSDESLPLRCQRDGFLGLVY